MLTLKQFLAYCQRNDIKTVRYQQVYNYMIDNYDIHISLLTTVKRDDQVRFENWSDYFLLDTLNLKYMNKLFLIVVACITFSCTSTHVESTRYTKLLERADSLSRVIMDNNNLLDVDGSDEMSELLDIRCQIDSIR